MCPDKLTKSCRQHGQESGPIKKMERLQFACVSLGSAFLSTGVLAEMEGEIGKPIQMHKTPSCLVEMVSEPRQDYKLMQATVTGHNNFCFFIIHLLLHNNGIWLVIIQFHHFIITFKASNLPKCHLIKCCVQKKMMNYPHKGKQPNSQNSLCYKSFSLL